MKRTLLAVLTVFILAHAPWRLIVLGVEVFFVSPGHTRISDQNTRYWEALALESNLIRIGWAVKYETPLTMMTRQGPIKVYGLTVTEEHTVYVDAVLSWDARYAVLAHEAGHVLQPNWMDYAKGDVFAEIIAALVVRDNPREHARYLSAYRGDFLIVALTEWRALYRSAALLRE
jgi:hypothetical protein